MAAPRKKTTTESTTCPWCSASVPVSAATCPSCGASLHEAAEGDVLGVTQVDLAAVSRASRITPNRLTSWLGAESTAEAGDLGGRVEPPSDEVRQEMLRIRLAAIDAELEAQKAQAEALRELAATEISATTPVDDVAGGPEAGEVAPEASSTDAPEAKPG